VLFSRVAALVAVMESVAATCGTEGNDKRQKDGIGAPYDLIEGYQAWQQGRNKRTCLGCGIVLL